MLASVTDVRNLIGAYAEDMASWLGGSTADQDALITRFIRAAQARMERDLRIRYDTQVIKVKPEPGAVYDIEEDPYDFWLEDYYNHGFIKLRRGPVISVQRVRLMYGDQTEIITYPNSWIRLDRKNGTIQILPTPGSGWGGLVLASGGYFLPLLTGTWLRRNVPQLICPDYTVGALASVEGGAEKPLFPEYWWEEHSLQCASLAAAQVLVELSDVYKPGLVGESISAEGLSESTQFTRGAGLRYQAKIAEYEQRYQRFVRDNAGHTAPILITVV